MKGMQKISRGGSFSGLMAYAFDGDLDNPRELEGEVLGGNMAGRDPKSLAREFGASRAVRPDIAKPVWHNSLRLPEGEKLDKEKWSEIGDAYMKKMGFSEHHQRVYVLHDDEAGQHIHVVASRIALDGSLFLGKNENLISTKMIAELEKEFGLTITKSVSYDEKGKVVMPDRSRPKSGEVGKFERTGEPPGRFVLTDLIDQAIVDKPSASVFAERLVLSGIEVRANFSKNKLNGFSFVIDGMPFKGSQLGKQYMGKSLFERGLSYEQNRDYAHLKQYNRAATEHAERDRPTRDLESSESSRDRAGSRPDPADGGGLRRSDREGAYRADPGLAHSDSTGPRRSESDDEHGTFRPGLSEQGRTDTERRHDSSEARTGATQIRENLADNTGSHGPVGFSRDQPADTSGGGGIDSGVDVSGVGPMHTGDEATDNLLKLAYKATTKEAQEAMARQKKGQAEYDVVLKKRLADAQATVDQLLGISSKSGRPNLPTYSYEKAQKRPYSSRLTALAAKSGDVEWRGREMSRFASAIGASSFDLAFSDPNKKRGPIKKTLSAGQLANPQAVRGLAGHFARSGEVFISPPSGDGHGVILLTGLTDESLQNLEAAGFPPAAVVDVAGIKQAWLRADKALTAEERQRLLERLSDFTGASHQANASGRLPGFSKGLQAVTLISATGQSAPALKEHLNEIRAEIQAQRISLKLDQSALTWSKLDLSSYQSVGGITTLKNGWFREARDGAQSDLMDRNLQVTNDCIETKILESMARQKLPVEQAFRAVFSESRVCAGIELDAAQLTTHAYARVALEREGKRPGSVDIDAEARRRFPAVFDRAESRIDSGLQAMQEQMKLDGQAEQMEIERKADDQRLAKALEAATKIAQESRFGPGSS